MLISTLATAADLCETGKGYFTDLGCKGHPRLTPYSNLPSSTYLVASMSFCLSLGLQIHDCNTCESQAYCDNMNTIAVDNLRFRGQSRHAMSADLTIYINVRQSSETWERQGRCVTATCVHIHVSVHNSPVLCTIDTMSLQDTRQHMVINCNRGEEHSNWKVLAVIATSNASLHLKDRCN